MFAHFSRCLTIIGFGFSALLMCLWFAGETPANYLEFDKTALSKWQLWRLVTGQWVHFTLYHVAMNAVGVLLIGLLLWPKNLAFLYLAAVSVLPVFVGLALWAYSPGMEVYRGYSGALYGVLAIALLLNVGKDPVWFGGGLILLFGKIVYEQLPWFDPSYMLAQIGAPVATEAHLYGVLAGVMLFGVHKWLPFGKLGQQ